MANGFPVKLQPVVMKGRGCELSDRPRKLKLTVNVRNAFKIMSVLTNED
jgi:hypothetical protein